MKPPTVSVIIPTFNRAHTLPAALDSVLAQEWPGLEVVVVDDGSTDDTPAVLARYGEMCGDSLRVVTQKNQGESVARNVGILAARSDIVAFLDSDNTWAPHKFSAQLPCLSTESVGFVFSGYSTFGAAPREVVMLGGWVNSRNAVLEALLQGCCVNTSTVVVRREWLVTCGLFDPSLTCCQDHDMWLRLAAAGFPMEYIAENLMSYRIDGEGTSSDESLVAASTERVFERLFDSGTLPVEFQARRNLYLSRCYLNSAVRYRRAGKSPEAIKALVRAVRKRPASFRPGWLRLGAAAAWQTKRKQ